MPSALAIRELRARVDTQVQTWARVLDANQRGRPRGPECVKKVRDLVAIAAQVLKTRAVRRVVGRTRTATDAEMIDAAAALELLHREYARQWMRALAPEAVTQTAAPAMPAHLSIELANIIDERIARGGIVVESLTL